MSRTGLPAFLEFLKLLESWDGTCFFNKSQNEKKWKRRKRSKRGRERERDKERDRETEKVERERERERDRETERERERERESVPGSVIGPCVRPVSDLFRTPAKGPSHIRKILPRIPSTSIAVQRLLEKERLKDTNTLFPGGNSQVSWDVFFQQIPEQQNGCGTTFSWQQTASKLTRTTWASKLKAWALQNFQAGEA